MQCHYLFTPNIGLHNFTAASYDHTIPILYTTKRGHANTTLRLVMPERVVSTLYHSTALLDVEKHRVAIARGQVCYDVHCLF